MIRSLCLASLLCLALLAAAPAAAQEPTSFKAPIEGVTFDLSLPRGWREQTGKATAGALLLEDSRRGATVTLFVKPAQTGSLALSKGAQRELQQAYMDLPMDPEEGFEERVGARLLHLRAAMVPFARFDHSQPTHARHLYAWMDGLRLWSLTLEVPLKEEAAVLRDLDPILDALVSQAAPVAPHRYALAVQGDSDDKEREAFYRFLAANMDRVAQCKANLRGLRLRVETGTDGKVVRAAALDAQGKEDSSREGAACVVEKVSAIRFPERKKEGLRFVVDLSNIPVPK